MCLLIEKMEGLKSSSSLSVANDKFTKTNEYMHIESQMDSNLKNVILNAKKVNKSLVLVCGNSGDGKSHLIANFLNNGVISQEEFDVYIDATSSDKKGVRANERLRTKLDEFSDSKLLDDTTYRLIVAINLGVLNDFLKNYENEFTSLKKYVDSQGLFDNNPSWRDYSKKNDSSSKSDYLFGHVDFTSFHRIELCQTGLDTSFFSNLFGKIITDSPDNEIFGAFCKECTNCTRKERCPVYWNYRELRDNQILREHVIYVISKAIIKANLSPSVREINNLFYKLIVGGAHDEPQSLSDPIERLLHLITNSTLWLLYESHEGLLQYVSSEDVLSDPRRSCDKELIALNLKPDFEKWLLENGVNASPMFKQIYNDILYCKNKNGKKYRDRETEIKQAVFKLYIRTNSIKNTTDIPYSTYLEFLFNYNIGKEDKCKDLIQLIEECVYLWNGRLSDKSGSNIKNGVIIYRVSDKYYLYKKLEVRFHKDISIKELSPDVVLPYFSFSMRFRFKLKESNTIIPLDVDFELYHFLLEVKNGYMPTNSDKKRNVKYDSFVRNLISDSDSDTYVYTRNDEGKTYKISKDDFDRYRFDYEV